MKISNYRIYKSPDEMVAPKNSIKLFLAGTIDMGSSENWQDSFTRYIINDFSLRNPKARLSIYSPRREVFDKSSEVEQIEWEMDRLDHSDVILINFLPESKSPISLLELGLYSQSKKLIVVCPKEFYRYHNVRLTCLKYRIPRFDNLYEINSNIIINTYINS